ncbi:MAG: 50S ribosomal protein L24 [Verrucomicrobiota bacterium]
MQKRFHVKKGDEVVVIAGSEKGKRGKIIEVKSKGERVIVEGIKMLKKHTKRNQNNPQGAIVEREGAIHISNVMAVASFDASKKRVTKEPAAA